MLLREQGIEGSGLALIAEYPLGVGGRAGSGDALHDGLHGVAAQIRALHGVNATNEQADGGLGRKQPSKPVTAE